MRLKINTDGGSRGNPGPAAAGVVIADAKGRTLFARGFYLGETTSNVAEYEGLLRALQEARKLGGSELEIFSDSELVVRQVNGQYRVKKAHLQNYHEDIVKRMAHFDKVTLQYVRREENSQADELVNRALNARRDVEGGIDAPLRAQSDKPIRAVIDVNDRIQFRETTPYREPLYGDKRYLLELICLSVKQRCQIKTIGSGTTLTVIRGGGVVEAGAEKIPVKTGAFLHINRASTLAIAAGADEELVVMVMQID